LFEDAIRGKLLHRHIKLTEQSWLGLSRSLAGQLVASHDHFWTQRTMVLAFSSFPNLRISLLRDDDVSFGWPLEIGKFQIAEARPQRKPTRNNAGSNGANSVRSRDSMHKKSFDPPTSAIHQAPSMQFLARSLTLVMATACGSISRLERI
jgi:hypothetical protein